MSTNQPLNREGWLHLFAQEITPLIERRTGKKVPLDRVRLSCSFPRGRAVPRPGKGFTTGQCWHGDTHSSGLHEIMINPVVADPITEDGRGICETVIHELLHATVEKGVGHKAPFARVAKLVGLEGRPTSTKLGDELRERVQEIIDRIGEYPHRALDVSSMPKQTTRLLKVYCKVCNYTTRITRKWLEDAGAPICPTCHDSMIEDGEEEGIKLKTLESHVVYAVPTEGGSSTDNRFQIRHSMSDTNDSWTVVDFGVQVGRKMTVTGPDGKPLEVELAPLGTVVPRIVAAEGRQDALDMISAVREGLYTWDDLEDRQGDDEDDEDDLDYLGDDEDENPDYPEDSEPEEWTHPITGKVTVFNYDEVAASREK